MNNSVCKRFQDLFETIKGTKSTDLKNSMIEIAIGDFEHHLTMLEGFLALGVGEELIADLKEYSEYFISEEYVPEVIKERIRVITA